MTPPGPVGGPDEQREHEGYQARRLPQKRAQRQRANARAIGQDVERSVNFHRRRHMVCQRCKLRSVVSLDWIDRWEQGGETCPQCGLDCEADEAARLTVDPGDLALDDQLAVRLAWYHTSIHADWPASNFDPLAGLSQRARSAMGAGIEVDRWADRQRARALHVGTYEAAVHNMLRRISDQQDAGRQFYLYRVYLQPKTALLETWVRDPSDFVGDVILQEVCPPGIDAVRYLNLHEDPGALSLALGRSAISHVQRIEIPAADWGDDGWIANAVVELGRVPRAPAPIAPGTFRSKATLSPRGETARRLAVGLARTLPVNLQRPFEAASRFIPGTEPRAWAQYVLGLFHLVSEPRRALAKMDVQPSQRL